MVEIDLCHIKHQTEITAQDYARADLPPPRSSSAAMAPDGGGGDGKPVEPHQGTVTPNKGRKRKSEQCDRAESVSPDSTITTTAAAQSRDGDGGVDQQLVTAATAASSSRGGDDGVEELQQQMNGKKPRLVWTSELHDKFVRACKNLGGRDKIVPKNILKEMNIRGLTRENVASHLQKYRMNLQGKGQAVRKRGKGGAPTMMHRTAPSLQPVFPQAQPIEPAFPQAPSPSPSANPPPHHQAGSFAAANNMSHPQIGHGQRQVVQAPPTLVHQQPHENFPVVMPPQLLYPPPQLQAAMEQQRKLMMERHAQHAARMTKQASVAPGHNRYMAPMNYELRAQMLARAPAAASGVQSHHLQPHMQAPHQAVNMSGGLYCPVPQASTRDEQMETRMGVARLQITVEPEAGQAPAAEPAFPGSTDPDNNNGSQQEDSCGILRFWNTTSAPSMDHEFPPKKPT